MRGSRLGPAALILGLTLAVASAASERAEAQAVGFGPVIGGVQDGVGLSVTPVATADRRYVRFNNLNVGFSNVLGFDTATVTGAVGGGGIGAGIGLPATGAFGFGTGGFSSVGVGGFGGMTPGAYGYGGYPYGGGYGYGYPMNPYGSGYGVSPYGLGGVRAVPPVEAQTANGLEALRYGIMGATRAPWQR